MFSGGLNSGRRRAAVCAASVIAAALLPVEAMAADAWQTQSVSEEAFGSGTILRGPDGPIVVWHTARTVDGAPTFELYLTTPQPDGTLATEKALTANGWTPQAVKTASGGILAVWVGADGHLKAAERPATGGFEPPVDLGEGGFFDLVENEAGAVALVFQRADHATATARIWATTRPPGGSFSAPHPISEAVEGLGGWDAHSAGLTANGDLVVAWREPGLDDRTAVKVKLEPVAGLAPPAQTMSPLNAYAVHPQVVPDPAGEGVLITWVERPDVYADAGPVYGALRGSSNVFGARFAVGASAQDDVDSGAVVSGGRVRLTWGDAAPIWGAVELGPARSRTIELDDGTLGPVETLSASYVSGRVRLATAPNGSSLAVFEDADGYQLHAARHDGSGWSPEENLFCPWPFADVNGVLMGSDGRAHVLWRQLNVMRDIDGLALTTNSTSVAASPGSCPKPEPELKLLTDPPRAGAPVRLDGSGARDPDAVTADFLWDLNRDWVADVETGSSPILERTYPEAGWQTVAVIVNQTSRDGDSATDGERIYFAVEEAAASGTDTGNGTGAEGESTATERTTDTTPDGTTAAPTGGDSDSGETLPRVGDFEPIPAAPSLTARRRIRMQTLLRRGLGVRLTPSIAGVHRLRLSLIPRPGQRSRRAAKLFEVALSVQQGQPVRLRVKLRRTARRTLARRLRRYRRASVVLTAHPPSGRAPAASRRVTVVR